MESYIQNKNGEEIYINRKFSIFRVENGCAFARYIDLKEKAHISEEGVRTPLTDSEMEQILASYKREDVYYPPERCLWESSSGESKTFDSVVYKDELYDRVI